MSWFGSCLVLFFFIVDHEMDSHAKENLSKPKEIYIIFLRYRSLTYFNTPFYTSRHVLAKYNYALL